MRLVEWEGQWYEEHPLGQLVLIPGVRPMKVKELVGQRTRRTWRSGEWIEIDRAMAHTNSELLTWCRRCCNSELPSGAFRFAPKDWQRHSEDSLSIPFVPELDHPSEMVQDLAAAERTRRRLEQELLAARNRRDELVRKASAGGHSRREVAEVLGISFGRIQQLVRQPRNPR
jgi:hypothetical protein